MEIFLSSESTVRQINRENALNFITLSDSYFINRSFRLTFEWRFGQMTTGSGKQGKKIANDDAGGR